MAKELLKKVLSHGTAQHGRCGSFTALPTHPLVIPQQDITLLEKVKKKKKNELSEGTDPHSFNQFFSFYSTVQYSVRVLLHYDAPEFVYNFVDFQVLRHLCAQNLVDSRHILGIFRLFLS